jgi:hypothetical protein
MRERDGLSAAAVSAAGGLIDAVGAPVDPADIAAQQRAGDAALDWARCGAMALTGPSGGSPALSPGAPASAADGALAVLRAVTAPDAALPDAAVLGERAALSGFRRQAPVSVGGSFRALRGVDGWFGISLARPSDLELVPALVQHDAMDGWASAASWVSTRPVADAVERARLLGLPACAVATAPVPVRRPPVVVRHRGARRTRNARPTVVDLTSLWAGPLCAHLLGLTGARVIKVESTTRPDGARRGSPAFFELLHRGHDNVVLDFETHDLARLLSRADVVLEGSRPRALRQVGIDAEAYADDGVVWASITAYGRDELDADRVGFGDDVAAAAGLIAHHDGVPYPVGDAIADPLAGLYAAAAVAAALADGHGALLDVSMFDVCVAVAQLPVARDAVVLPGTDGTWRVRAGDQEAPVLPPRARHPWQG